MKKLASTICAVFLLISLNECAGYKPIFSSGSLGFEISDYTIKGDKTLGNRIYSKLKNLSKSEKNNQDIKNIFILINVSKNKNATSKDNAGKILEYKITLNTKIEVKDDLTENEMLNKNFTFSQAYKVQTQYSDTLDFENRTLENLINKTYQQLLIELSKKIDNT